MPRPACPIVTIPLSSWRGTTTFLQVVSKVLPATHFIAISRGIIIRGAGFMDLWPNVAALVAISALLVVASTRATYRPFHPRRRLRSGRQGDERSFQPRQP